MNLNKILFWTALIISLAIISITAVFLSKSNIMPGAGLEKISDIKIEQSHFTAPVTPEKTTFTKIGQLRTGTKKTFSENSATMIVTPILEYKGNDDQFYEELDSKTVLLRKIIVDYFSNHTLSELNKKGEYKVKEELMKKINEQLVLQKIQQLYFSEYLTL